MVVTGIGPFSSSPNGRVGIGAHAQQGRAARDEARSFGVKEVEQWNGAPVADGRSRSHTRSADPDVERVRRCHDTGKRAHPVQLDVEAHAQHDPDLPVPLSQVDGADGEHIRPSTGPRDAAESRPGRPVVPHRRDDQGVEPASAGGGERKRPVCKGGERLDHPDEGDTGGIVCIAVPVRIDGTLEPGQHLVGSSVDGPASGGVALPPRDPDR
jgi:hypothetical protein